MALAELIPELTRWVERERERLVVPGVVVGIAHGDQTLELGFGVTNVDHPLPVDERTLFQIGSTTKTFVATALLQQVEEGALDLDAPLVRYLPNFALGEAAYTPRVTIRHLLTHTAGWLGDYFILKPLDFGRGEDALERVVASMPRVPVLTEPGGPFSYNNIAFNLAGRLLEVLTGSSFEAAIRERVFEPLGLDHSFFFAEDLLTERVAAGHWVREGGARVARPWALPRSSHASGAIVSDVRDQLRYARFHLGDGTGVDGERVLLPSTLADMQAAHAEAGSMCDEVGLPWLIRRVGNARIVGHGGATNGFLSSFDLVPEHDFALTILTNSDAGARLYGPLRSWLLDRVLGVREAKPAFIDVPDEALDSYAGTYALGYAMLERDDAHLVLRLSALPDADEAPAPIRLAFTAVDRVQALDPEHGGARGEFLRSPDGAISFFRWGGRLLFRGGAQA